MSRARRIGMALATGLVAVAALGGSASGSMLALQDDQLPNLSGQALEQRLDLLKSTGTTVTRVDILWGFVAPTQPADATDPGDPAYDWARYDQIFKGLAARDITPIVDFYWTPKWASSTGDKAAAPRVADASAFAAAIARRYNGTWPDGAGGTLPLIRRIEIWNEPNIATYWYPQCRRQGRNFVLDSARQYAALLAASYSQVKAVSPTAIVTGGVTGPAGDEQCGALDSSVGALTFTKEMVRNHVPIDAWSMHLYPIGSPAQAYFMPSWRSVPQIQAQVDRLNPGAPIYVTETGYHTSYNRYHRYFVSEAQQAAWVTETKTVADRYPRVQVAMWFNLQDNPYWTGGLLRQDMSQKPAWGAFRQAAAGEARPADWSR